MEFLMELNSDRSERVRYNTAALPAYVRKGLLSFYPNYSAVSHWHDDVEFIAVLSGRMLYNVNGNIIALNSGEGIFVNARQIHYGFSKDAAECEFICVLLHPVLLCACPYVEQTYVAPVLANTAFTHWVLRESTPWQGEVLSAVKQLYELQGSPLFALRLQSLFYQIWAALYEHAPNEQPQPVTQSHRLSALKDMMGYIQTHYPEKIRLEEIAAAGKVCKSSCCALFQHYLKLTPIAYLTDYRLKKSVDLMRTTDKTITEISYQVGFSGASYYTETFRKYFGTSPTEYRATQQG